jgi:hypothetical protein
MNATTVARIVSLIPDRTARVQSGSAFTKAEALACSAADRVAYVARFLQWLSPLNPISKDDQRALGLVSSNGRPLQAGGEPGEELAEDLAEDLTEDLEDELSEPEVEPLPSASRPAVAVLPPR